MTEEAHSFFGEDESVIGKRSWTENKYSVEKDTQIQEEESVDYGSIPSKNLKFEIPINQKDQQDLSFSSNSEENLKNFLGHQTSQKTIQTPKKNLKNQRKNLKRIQ